MSDAPKWLQEYYGKDFDFLNPTVFEEGPTHAIIRLQKTTSIRGAGDYSSVGFVMIKKNGRHVMTTHVSLHEGIPTVEDAKRMSDALKARELEAAVEGED